MCGLVCLSVFACLSLCMPECRPVFSMCARVCKRVSVCLWVLMCVCNSVYEFWPGAYVCLKVCLQISMTSQLVQPWLNEISQGSTEISHSWGTIWARPGRRASHEGPIFWPVLYFDSSTLFLHSLQYQKCILRSNSEVSHFASWLCTVFATARLCLGV